MLLQTLTTVEVNHSIVYLWMPGGEHLCLLMASELMTAVMVMTSR